MDGGRPINQRRSRRIPFARTNLQTAKAFGLMMTPKLIAPAGEVIA
jgi:hypothetical protein